MTFVYLFLESELTTERWRNMLESEIYWESLIGVAVDEVQATTRLFSFLSFLCVVFRDSHNFNHAILTPADLCHQ